MALLFVNFLLLNMLPRFVDCTRFALFLPFLDLAVNDLPSCGSAVFAEAPFLELTLVLAFTADRSEAWPRARSAGGQLLSDEAEVCFHVSHKA